MLQSAELVVVAVPPPLFRGEASVIVLWRKRLHFKTMRKRGRLTLHVRRLVHISQVSGVFLKSNVSAVVQIYSRKY